MNSKAMDLEKKKDFKKLLTLEVGKQEADRIWDDAKKRLSDIEHEHPDIPAGVKMHTDFIFPSAAIYLAIKEARSAELGYKVISTISWDKSRKMGRMLSCLVKIPGFRKWFVKMWDPISHKAFGESAGFENVFYPPKEGEFRMDILKCPYDRYFRELGCPELTKVFCINDECSYGNIPGLNFVRTQTLGKGGEKCDFYIGIDQS